MEKNTKIKKHPTKDEIVKGKIANALTSAAKNHIVATTDDLYDSNFLEYQDEINQSIFETLSGVAKEDTLVTGISNIREDISKIELDTSGLAKEDTLVEGVAYIVNKIETTQPDLSTIAKEYTLVAGISDIMEDISEIELDTSDLAKEETLTTGVSNIINDVDLQANAVTSAINSKTENIIDTVNNQANAVIDTVNSQTGNVINSVNTNTTSVVEYQAQGIQDNINAKTTDILNTVNTQAQVISTSIVNQTDQIISNNNQQTSTITSTVNQQAQSTNNIINSKTGDIINTVNTQAQSLANDIVNLGDNLDSGVTRIFDAINLIKEELQGENSAITLTYLYDTLGDLSTLLDEINGEEMPVEFATDYARQGNNPNATLSEVQTQATSAANDAAAAKTVAQGITGYALQGSGNATQTDIASAIGTPATGQSSTLFAAIAAVGGASVQEIVSGILNAVAVPMSYDGVVFNEGYGGESFLKCVIEQGQIISIIDNSVTQFGGVFPIKANVERLELNALVSFYDRTNQRFGSMVNLKYFKADYVSSLGYNYGNNAFLNNTKLEVVSILNAIMFDNQANSNVQMFSNCPNVIDLITGVNYTQDQHMESWNPTNALRDDTSDLVHDGETFTSNKEKLLYNIREHFAKNLRGDVGNHTLYMSAEIKAAIQADAATLAAFPSNWTIA